MSGTTLSAFAVMRRTTIAGAVGLIFTLSVLGQQVFKLVPKDKSFEVSFPDEPRHEQRDSDSGRIHVEAHSYSWENTTSKFILTYVHLTPAPADLKPSDALDSAISALMAVSSTLIPVCTNYLSCTAMALSRLSKTSSLTHSLFGDRANVAKDFSGLCQGTEHSRSQRLNGSVLRQPRGWCRRAMVPVEAAGR
jgi:hypothetical protein